MRDLEKEEKESIEIVSKMPKAQRLKLLSKEPRYMEKAEFWNFLYYSKQLINKYDRYGISWKLDEYDEVATIIRTSLKAKARWDFFRNDCGKEYKDTNKNSPYVGYDDSEFDDVCRMNCLPDLFSKFPKFWHDNLEYMNSYFDKVSATGKGLEMPNFPIMSEKLEGLERGIYLIAGESNTGKSALALAMFLDICRNNKNCYGVYLAIDDVKSDIISRIIAQTMEIPITVAKKPTRFSENKELIQKLKLGIDRVYVETLNYSIMDIQFIEDLYKFVSQHNRQGVLHHKQLVFVIDAIDDLMYRDPNKQNYNQTQKQMEISKDLKLLANDYDLVILGVRHMSKIGTADKLSLDRIKDSNQAVYDAGVCLLCWNELGKKDLQSEIYYTDGMEEELEENGFVAPDDVSERFPILEVRFAKNKKSSYKGTLYFKFFPNFSKIEECKPILQNYYTKKNNGYK